MRTVDELRQGYLDYFQERGHLLVPSSSLVPSGDPTLLLTTAGMVQFKPYFLGEAAAPRSRMTSAQKCFRTTDIEEVGDHKHLTFFEMLGNFSVGDYIKQGAIEFAWEFVTQHLELPPDKLFLTVYTDDDEAEALWSEISGAPPERLYRYGKSDNWWGPPGAEGPCGPCSELHYDFGEALGCAPLASPVAVAAWVAAGMKPEDQPGCHPNCDRCERFVEFWNLVFMQYY
ncbi:MAG: alanine--tRNA ligase-related protein, partial [Chloroflexota bacterium]|nr:alanine--tRNA ligase-related protein [Chloroflexota bacterium]